MASEDGNAVVAEWAGPSGHQLFDGTLLEPGSVIVGIGKDEAEGSDYWKVLGDVDSYSGESHGDASSRASDPSFGTEEGGGSTGRPLTDAQQEEAKAERKTSRAPKSVLEPAPVDTPATEVTE